MSESSCLLLLLIWSGRRAMSLRDALITSLAKLPGRREFHIHVLVSAPRKRIDLFPYATPRPRAYLQDIVILLSEQTTFDGPRVMVSAIEAALYNVPTTSCGILYISKVDSTGQTTRPSPTAALVHALLKYYADPSTRPIQVDHLWVQLFARAQGQYLFPNSVEYPGKKPLAGVQLCAWWKRVLTDVTKEIRQTRSDVTIRPYYVLPGYSELEAVQSLKIPAAQIPSDASAALVWIYGHPHSQSDVPLPCPPGAMVGGRTNLGHFIPSFEDDPKSRFMDEIAHTTNGDGVSSPKRKRRKSDDRRAEPPDDDEDGVHVRGELDKVSAEEFWERMSFRQECISGVVTAFFVVAFSSPRKEGAPIASTPSPLAPQPGQVSPEMVRRVISTLMNHHDFSTKERALRATETLESAIKGLCEDLALVPSSSNAVKHVNRPSTPEPGASHLLEPPRTPPRRGGLDLPDISPNPFPDPVASLETYHSYIYGSVAVDNPPLAPRAAPAGGQADSAGSGDTQGQPQVTVLTVRKKRKAPS